MVTAWPAPTRCVDHDPTPLVVSMVAYMDRDEAGLARAVIVNILDIRADHQAIFPIDALLMGYRPAVDGNGVQRANVTYDLNLARHNLSLTSAIEWAAAKDYGVVLSLFDATSQLSKLAEERSANRLSRVMTLSELDLVVLIGEMVFVEDVEAVQVQAEAEAEANTAQSEVS